MTHILFLNPNASADMIARMLAAAGAVAAPGTRVHPMTAQSPIRMASAPSSPPSAIWITSTSPASRPNFRHRQPGALALLSGTFVTPALTADYGRLIALLRAQGFVVALHTGLRPGGRTDAVRAQVLSWLPLRGHLLLNEVETQGLAVVTHTGEAAAAILSGLPRDAVLVIKCGADGANVFQSSEMLAVPAPAVVVIDTIGAGDAFNAGYLSASPEAPPAGSHAGRGSARFPSRLDPAPSISDLMHGGDVVDGGEVCSTEARVRRAASSVAADLKI